MIRRKLHEEYLRKKYGTEEVFIVPYSFTEKISDGFSIMDEKSFDAFAKNVMPHGKFLLRSDAEENITFQQIIPYVLVTDLTGERFFVTRRIRGEKRLIGNLSLGIGGHINPVDDVQHGDYREMIFHGLQREVIEETSALRYAHGFNIYGTARDLGSSTPDHIGLVFKMPVEETAKVEVREKDTLEPAWMTKKELIRNYEKFESWAKMIITDLVIEKAA